MLKLATSRTAPAFTSYTSAGRACTSARLRDDPAPRTNSSSSGPLARKLTALPTGFRLPNKSGQTFPHMTWRTPASGHRWTTQHVRCLGSSVPSREGPDSKGIVITGASRGLGFALATEFLERGDRLVLCGRDADRLAAAAAALKSRFPGGVVHHIVCDVSEPAAVQNLGKFAAQALGTVHLWINNAGEVTRKRLLSDLDAAEVTRVVGTNVTGSLLCCREAVALMRSQPWCAQPVYHIFNFGFSSWGAGFSKSACTHKATKVALRQLTQGLAAELKEAGITSIGVHNVSPGMVLTDLLLKDSTPAARRFFNTLAEEPETAATALAPRIRGAAGSGSSIDFLTPISAFARVLTGVPQIINGGRFFDKNGNRVVQAGESYHDNGTRVLFEQFADTHAQHRNRQT